MLCGCSCLSFCVCVTVAERSTLLTDIHFFSPLLLSVGYSDCLCAVVSSQSGRKKVFNIMYVYAYGQIYECVSARV